MCLVLGVAMCGCCLLAPPKYYIGGYDIPIAAATEESFRDEARGIVLDLEKGLGYIPAWINDDPPGLDIGLTQKSVSKGVAQVHVVFGWFHYPNVHITVRKDGVEPSEEVLRARKVIESVLRKRGFTWSYDLSHSTFAR